MRRFRFRLKGLGLLLLLVLLVLCSSIDVCEARRGKHWRAKRAPSTSLTRKKGKGKTGGYRPSPSPNPPANPSPNPSPSNGKGKHSPKKPPSQSPSNPKKAPTPIPTPTPNPSPSHGKGYTPSAPPSPAVIFNVLDFGAKGDGVTDDTQAFEAAWAAACKVEASTILVPCEFEFLVGPISFSGLYCQPNIVFQMDGTIIAPTSAKAWGSGLLQWLEFTKLRGITIQGSGNIEGRGSVWWTYSNSNDDSDDEPYFDFDADASLNSDVDPVDAELTEKMPPIKPTALRFYGSFNVTVTGINIQNSPQCHLKFDSCEAVMVHNITISSPGNSLNTDGIHLQNSKDVTIHHTNVACGDDCVSIQTGCTNINIHNVNCGPGHGISIGGLGRDNTKACVSNITVRDINMQNTMVGVRIKTWQGGSGLVQGIRFSNIRVSEVQTPIMIDQFYCDRTTCKNQSSAVAVSGVQYENIRGTFTVKPVHFACSDSSPCSDITLTGVELKPLQEQYHIYDPFCWHAYGELYTLPVPPITCLQIGKPASNGLLSDHDTC